MRTRRLIAGSFGGLLLMATFAAAYYQTFWFYREHFVWPKEKYGVLTPLRWQDVVFLFAFWLVSVSFFYLSYRLFKYSVGGTSRIPDSAALKSG